MSRRTTLTRAWADYRALIEDHHWTPDGWVQDDGIVARVRLDREADREYERALRDEN